MEVYLLPWRFPKAYVYELLREEMGIKFIFLAILLLGNFCFLVTAEPVQDKQALLDFVKKIYHSHPINWGKNSSACDEWIGVTCNHDKTRIIGLRLPGFGFQGSIPTNTISRLSALQILSLRSNSISGHFPSDFSKLGNLTILYLHGNKFTGPLPSDFTVWKTLSVINLSNNFFSGSISPSISNLTHLSALNLANNSLSGAIPDIDSPTLQWLDLSNNNLTGNVPQSLRRFPIWAFSGNDLPTDDSPPPTSLPSKARRRHKSSKLSEHAILGIISGCSVLGFLAFASLLIFRYFIKQGDNQISAKLQKEKGTMQKSISKSQDANGRLVFFEGCNLAFDLEDLLRASAEVLGKGTFGVTYKAALEDSTVMVVKRLTEVTVARQEFEQQMEVAGNIRHENVVTPRAYYHSKDEKLMVYDHYSQGSVSVMLHANRGENRIPLDWDTRLRIAIGAARGIAYIHQLNGGKLVHGDIKASNVFLNSQLYGCVADLGLATLMSPIIPPLMRSSGYRAPEVTDTRKVSRASDVYSFGVLLLELLTGKSPIHATGGEEVIHLVRWVHSVVREEWTAEVFDVELLRYPDIEEELVEMLQIGMACVTRMPEKRTKMPDVVKMIEDIRKVNARNWMSVETISNGSTPTLVSSPTAEIGYPLPSH